MRWLGFLDRHEKAEKGCVRINLHLQSARTRNEDDALRFANATDYGLSSAVYCGDLERGVRFAQAVEAGMACVNDTSLGDEAHAAFGGEKNSGIGQFGSEWIIDEFTSTHWTSVQHTPRAYPF